MYGFGYSNHAMWTDCVCSPMLAKLNRKPSLVLSLHIGKLTSGPSSLGSLSEGINLPTTPTTPDTLFKKACAKMHATSHLATPQPWSEHCVCLCMKGAYSKVVQASIQCISKAAVMPQQHMHKKLNTCKVLWLDTWCNNYTSPMAVLSIYQTVNPCLHAGTC